jgi:hypothetical protein
MIGISGPMMLVTNEMRKKTAMMYMMVLEFPCFIPLLLL